jgi:serine protease Do
MRRLILLAALLGFAWRPLTSSASELGETFKRVNRSVVVVRTKESAPPPSAGDAPTSTTALGSGVLISHDGKILTAAHVIQAADEVAVEFPGGELIDARVTGSSQAADVALLELARPPTDAVPAKLGDSDKAEVGDQVFVVGAPLGESQTLTVGYLSAIRREGLVRSGFAPVELLQTDAAINAGNSGGPMFNLAGEVIGIVSHMITASGIYEGMGFAVTSNTARHLLIEEKTPWTGFDGYLLTGDLAHALNVPEPVSVLVQRVAAGSPAARIGLRAGTMKATIGDDTLLVGGDVILALDDIPIQEFPRVRQKLSHLGPGDKVSVTVLRGGGRVTLTGTLGAPSGHPSPGGAIKP